MKVCWKYFTNRWIFTETCNIAFHNFKSRQRFKQIIGTWSALRLFSWISFERLFDAFNSHPIRIKTHKSRQRKMNHKNILHEFLIDDLCLFIVSPPPRKNANRKAKVYEWIGRDKQQEPKKKSGIAMYGWHRIVK